MTAVGIQGDSLGPTTALDDAKKLKASGTLTEDGLNDLEIDVQKLTDKSVKQIDDHLERKEAEVMKI